MKTQQDSRSILGLCVAGLLIIGQPLAAQDEANQDVMGRGMQSSTDDESNGRQEHFRDHAADNAHAVRLLGSSGVLDYSTAIPAIEIDVPTLFEPRQGLVAMDAIDDEVQSAQAVVVNWSALDSLVPEEANRLKVLRPDGEVMELVLLSGEYFGPNEYVWIGEIADVAASDVILVRVNDAVRVVARDYRPTSLGGKGTFELQKTAVSGHVATVRSPEAVGECGVKPGNQHPGRNMGAVPRGAGNDDGGVASSGPGGGDDPSNLIDIMTVPTNQAKAAYGEEDAFVADSRAMVADLNLRIANSGGSWSYRLCAAEWSLINYNETADQSTDLARLRWVAGEWPDWNGNGVQDPGEEEPDPNGFMDEIQDNRDTYRPDLIHLITENPEPAGGDSVFIGLAYRLRTTTGSVQTGYGLTVRSYAISSGTFAHEIGHNMGLCHNVEQLALCDMLQHGHGIARKCDGGLWCNDGEWRTTMSYKVCQDCDPNIKIPFFSATGLVVHVAHCVTGNNVCDLELWDDQTARAIDAANESRVAVADYYIGSSQIWAESAVFQGNGTFLDPRNSISTAVSIVQGGADNGVVKARAGTYSETGGGNVILSNPCKIEMVNGTVIIN